MNTLAHLSEDSRRLIIALLFIFLFIFLIIGSIGLLVKKIMKKQALGADEMLYNVVKAKVITNRKDLIKFGIKKNFRRLFKEAWIPFVIMASASFVLIIYCITMNNWSVDIFDNQVEGIGTLFHTFNWSETPKTKVFGITLISDWPPLATSPHWSWKAWGSYIFCPAMLVGIVWFLVAVQAYIARSFRIIKVSKKVFSHSLDDLKPEEKIVEDIKPE